MGARIAAHIANAGFPVLLLDRVLPEHANRNALAEQALKSLLKSKPAAFFDPDLSRYVRAGNFQDDLERLQDCDWVIEAVAEDLEIKHRLLESISPHLRSDAILTTNTSGLPVALIGEKLPEGLRRRWFGTHFFNPPRYMRLLEVIATPQTDPDAVDSIAKFAEMHLGKIVVPAHDTRNFIANRIGTFAMLNTFRVMREMKLSIEEIDLLTGTAIGWPKTGTFRLADLVGIDVLHSVAQNFTANVSDERSDVKAAEVLEELVARKWIGDKTGQGFYKKERSSAGKETRLVLDLDTFDYRAATRPNFAELEMARSRESVAERIHTLLAADSKRDKAAAFYWQILPELWSYAANRIGEVADTLIDIDRAMKAGFNWELGPFEMWDAAGVAESVEHMRAAGQAIPNAAERLLAAGGKSWYRADGGEFFDPFSGKYRPVPEIPGFISLARTKRVRGVIEKNPGASLIDLGDGIACIEFHSKMNTIGEDIVRFMRQVFQPDGAAMRNFEAFIITSDAVNFSVGANLMQVLLAIQEQEWDEISRYIREFQEMTQAVKFCARPVVAAPFGMCLGGGVEIVTHSAARQAHVESYMGLVETAVGLIPGGGGCKEMTLRALESASLLNPEGRSDSLEVNEALKTTFETIAMAKTSTSALEAQKLGFLRSADEFTMNRGRLVTDAKRKARLLANGGYASPIVRKDISAPGAAVLANLKLAVHMLQQAGYISDHDAKIGSHLASILCGGNITSGTLVSEQYFLDLEREAFLSLCGEPKTLERIASTLKTGKPLRN